MRQEKRN